MVKNKKDIVIFRPYHPALWETSSLDLYILSTAVEYVQNTMSDQLIHIKSVSNYQDTQTRESLSSEC